MKVAFLFAGQGSQNLNMGFEIYNNFDVAKKLLDEATKLCKIDFKSLMFKKNELLNQSEFTQPAIVLNSLMTFLSFKQCSSLGQEFSLGHSLGEFTALAVSGGFDMLDAINLVHLRGKFMQDACANKNVGMMAVLGLDDKTVEDICKNSQKSVWTANYNYDGQIIVAGIKNDLMALEEEFKRANARRVMLLNMSVASHCPLLNSASEKLYVELQNSLNEHFNLVISNVTAKKYSTKSQALNLLKSQLVKPVLYKQSIKNYENDIDIFIEFGSNILKGLNKKITQKPTYHISDMLSLEQTLKELS